MVRQLHSLESRFLTMMATMKKQHSFLFLALLIALSACTDARPPRVFKQDGYLPDTGPLIQVANVQFGGGTTSVYAMASAYGSLFVTGKPFWFARWDITADPENPHSTYAAYPDHLNTFSPAYGGWVVDQFGASAIGVFGNFALTSGSFGASLLQIGPSAQNAQEVVRLPPPDKSGQGADPSWEFKSIAAIPNTPYVFGFTEQDGAYKIDASNPQYLSRSYLAPYSRDANNMPIPVCCNTGAAVLAGKMFMAMRNRLIVLNISPSSDFTPYPTQNQPPVPQIMQQMQPVGVFATSRYLYVHHQPTSANTGQRPGIYVFDQNLNQVTYFPIQPFVFAISQDDSHVYSNEDDKGVKIYRFR